jgi:hypothetical protein
MKNYKHVHEVYTHVLQNDAGILMTFSLSFLPHKSWTSYPWHLCVQCLIHVEASGFGSHLCRSHALVETSIYTASTFSWQCPGRRPALSVISYVPETGLFISKWRYSEDLWQSRPPTLLLLLVVSEALFLWKLMSKGRDVMQRMQQGDFM